MSKKPCPEREESIAITDQATLKVILHPLRTRLITAMSQGPRSVKELAEAVEAVPGDEPREEELAERRDERLGAEAER